MLATIALCALAFQTAPDSLQLAPVFGDHMVLQAGMNTKLWGRAPVASRIKMEFAGQVLETLSNSEGDWDVTLTALEASKESRELTVTCGDERLEVQDVLVGEVWICSGQSNMAWPLRASDGFEVMQSAGDLPGLRTFRAPQVSAHEPRESIDGRWKLATTEDMGDFSGVAFYFGRRLHAELDVPIGLVDITWGGSSVEAWTRVEALRDCPSAARVLDEMDRYSQVLHAKPLEAYAGAAVDDSTWEVGTLPAHFKDLGFDIDGVAYFRRTVEVPEGWAGKDLVLALGKIDDEDITWWNDVKVGATGGWDRERVYSVPAQHVRAGKATIGVRVVDGSGPGGIWGERELMKLYPRGAEDAALELAGEWRFRPASDVTPHGLQQRPGALHNGMVWPLRNLKFRGVIWYQGENNAFKTNSHEYRGMLPVMIADWRKHFGATLPFYFVQLPNFAQEGDGFWDYPTVRDAQLHTYKTVPYTGMAITYDVGKVDDIHPPNKIDVGERLARWALARDYDLKVVESGPIVDQVVFGTDGRILITFDTFGSELRVRGDELSGFDVAGEDGEFRPAAAELMAGGVVVVDGKEPREVRFAWRNDPKDANLVNVDGLPASPFWVKR